MYIYSDTSRYNCFWLQIFQFMNQVLKKYLFRDATKSSRYKSNKTQSQKKITKCTEIKVLSLPTL